MDKLDVNLKIFFKFLLKGWIDNSSRLRYVCRDVFVEGWYLGYLIFIVEKGRGVN